MDVDVDVDGLGVVGVEGLGLESRRQAMIRRRTYSATLARISNPKMSLSGSRVESAMVKPPNPHPMSKTSGAIE